MGKENRRKNRAKVISAKKKHPKPDDYFRQGPIEMARFGKFLVYRSNMSEQQFEMAQDSLVERFPEVCREIDDKILRIVEMVRKLPPGELLQRAYWEKAAHHINIKSEIEVDQDGALSMRMIDYVQSIIVSTKPAEIMEPKITEELWQELRTLVGDLFSVLNTQYMICHTAVNRKLPDCNMDFEEFYFKAQLYWCNVRGHRYLVHDIPFFRDVLSPHNDIMKELYGIGVEEILDGLQQIQESLTIGIGVVLEDMAKFKTVAISKVEEKIAREESTKLDDLPIIMSKVIEENRWENWRDDIIGKFIGLDLFNITKITKLPRALLEELSWEPGQDTEFFQEGQYRGWPLRIWPVFKRPFIKLEGNFFCFDIYSLFDHFYRIIQRILVRKQSEYSSIWNDKQKELSERIPLDLLTKLLPGAEVYNNVYYRWFTASGIDKQWCEADALMIYDDHLIIIEVKAGAFTYTSPATDFPAYIDSLRNLVFKPAEQGKRFLQYLDSDDAVQIYDCHHNEISKLSRKDFEHITICAITLDLFTELAAQIQHLKKIGIDVGKQPIWSLSLDDLRTYSDIFDNPLIFLHFIEQRMLAFQSDLIQSDDELDHLGLYFKHNLYTQYAQDLCLNGHITWHGYRENIDRFFSDRLHNPATKCTLKQQMPTHFKEIVDFLATSKKAGRRKVSSMLLNYGSEWRERINHDIDMALEEQNKLGHAKPLSTYGSNNITFLCWQKGLLERNELLAIEHTKAVMLVTQESERLLLELTFDAFGKLTAVNFNFLILSDISPADVEKLKDRADTLRVKRINNAKEIHGKIGRNDPCPCGSGRKFKKCCQI